MAKAVNAIVEWIKGIIDNMLKPLLDPIYNSINGWAERIATAFLDGIELNSSITQSKQPDTNWIEEIINAILSAGGITTLVMGLALGVVILQTIIGILQSIPGIGTIPMIVGKIIMPEITTAFAERIAQILAVGVSINLGVILGLIAPSDDPVWGLGVTTRFTIATLVTLLVQIYVGKKKGVIIETGDKDIDALQTCIFSLFLTYTSTIVSTAVERMALAKGFTQNWAKWLGNVAAFSLTIFSVFSATIATVKAVMTKTVFDESLGFIGYLDEIIDLLSTGYDIGQAIQTSYGVAKGPS
ncbi:MAG: hypothetical protein ACP5LE_08165 [Thermoplasmata archaeon]